MPDAVPGMKRKRPGDGELDHALGHGAEAAEPLRHRGRLEVPAQQRGDEVCGAEEVEAAGEGAAGDAVRDGGVPGHLRLVDGQVRGDGPVQALRGEDGVCVGGFRGLRLGGRFGG